METNLSPAEIVAWLRGRAKQFSDMADTIEQPVRSNGRKPTVEKHTQVGSFDDSATTGRVADLLLDGKARRVTKIASDLSINEGVVNIIIERHADMFNRNERGWGTLNQ